MGDHDEQYHAFTSHSLILPPLFIAQVTGLPSKRKSGEDRIFREKKQYIQVSSFLAPSKGRQLSRSDMVLLLYLKIHSFQYLTSTGVVI